MPKYLVETTYTAEGIRGLLKDKASARRQAVEKLLQSVDGKLEAFYYAMGDRDVVTIVDLPDAAAAAAISFTGSATGLFRVTTTPLLTVEEVDRALAKKLSFRAPGQ
ncbi:MAG TPA: GYD domain-containing protein [Steroidobacteraceae bacterium]|nr:GYD domain-containing protein [Steroidobacteraceae bacterium]